jgi:hypothetical protein
MYNKIICTLCKSPTTNRPPTKLVKIYPIDPDDVKKKVLVPTYVHVSCVIDTSIRLEEMQEAIYEFKAKVLGIFPE